MAENFLEKAGEWAISKTNYNRQKAVELGRSSNKLVFYAQSTGSVIL